MGFINTRTELGERATLDGLISGTLTGEFKDDTTSTLNPPKGSYWNFPTKTLAVPYASRYSGESLFSDNTTVVMAPRIKTLIISNIGYNSGYITSGCTYANTIDLVKWAPNSNNWFQVGTYAFQHCTSLKHFVLRETSVRLGISTVNALDDTSFASGRSGGTIYVPNAFVTTYRTMSNWSTYDAYGTITWQPIESTYLRIDGETEEVDFVTLWKTSTKYSVDQYVYYDGAVYKCLVAHTSADTTPDSDAENWSEEPSEDISTYKPLQYYYVDGSPIAQSITKTLGTYGHSSNTDTFAYYDDPYETTITVDYGHILNSVTVTMSGTDVTSTVYDSETGVISIAAVKGPITITVSAT